MLSTILTLALTATRTFTVGEITVGCDEQMLFETKAGVVQRRVPLIAPCTELVQKDGGYDVRVGDENAQPPWTYVFHRTIGEGQPERYILSPGAQQQAKKSAERAATSLEARVAIEHDATNPWLHVTLGKRLLKEGDKAGAERAFAGALTVDPMYDFDLVRVSRELEVVDSALADQAFDRGMRYLRQHGYEPELTTSLLAGAVYIGKPPGEPVNEAEFHERNSLRWLDFAPRSEAIAGYWRFLEHASDDAEKRALFSAAHDRAKDVALLGPMPFAAKRAGLMLNWLVGGGFMIVLMAIARAVSGRRAEPRRLWPLYRWTRAELLGLALAVASVVVAGFVGARGIRFMGEAAAVPLELAMGQLDHPLAFRVLREAHGTSATDRMFALGLIMKGSLDEADRMLQRYPSAFSANNRGVIALRKGDAAAARKLFEAALTDDPSSDARYNLARLDQKPAESNDVWQKFRFARAEHYGVAALLTMPSDGDVITLHETRLERKRENVSPFMVAAMLQSMSAVAGTLADLPDTIVVSSLALLVVCLLAVLRLFVRPKSVAQAGTTRELVASLLVPGAAMHYGVLSALVAALTGFLAFATFVLAMTGGESADLLSAIASPSVGHFFLRTEPEAQPLRYAFVYLLVVYVANAVIVIMSRKAAARA